jgi:YHS domain-containing protein
MTVCPVCDLQVDDDEALEQGLTAEYEDVFYYFSSQDCKERFESDPQRYANQTNGRHWLEDVEQGSDR